MLKHRHLMVSAEVESPPSDSEELNSWLVLLVKRIGMQIATSPELIKNPQSYFCNKNGNKGMTGVIILETSNCTVHTWSEDFPAKFELDLYSCAGFDPEDVKKLIDIFKIIRYNSLLIDRQNGLEIIDSYLPSFKETTNGTTETQSGTTSQGNSTTKGSPHAAGVASPLRGIPDYIPGSGQAIIGLNQTHRTGPY